MTYVVTEACIRCKYMDCVEVCPVDCFYEGANMLVIHPDECIDCGVCEPECPPEAILPDNDPSADAWLELNTTYSETWPNITRKLKVVPKVLQFCKLFRGGKNRRPPSGIGSSASYLALNGHSQNSLSVVVPTLRFSSGGGYGYT